jgi:hypothetical protein
MYASVSSFDVLIMIIYVVMTRIFLIYVYRGSAVELIIIYPAGLTVVPNNVKNVGYIARMHVVVLL